MLCGRHLSIVVCTISHKSVRLRNEYIGTNSVEAKNFLSKKQPKTSIDMLK